jgi:putative DNA primase/helicase
MTSDRAAPEHLVKMAARVEPADAATPVFDRFVQDISLRDAQLAGYLLRFLGYALTGLTKEQIFLNLFGKGKNGKTTLLELLLYIFGTYATTIAEDLVIDGAASTKTENSAADLQNKRLAVLADCNRGTLNDAMIKKITGGDTLRARRLYRESFEFIPKCKLIVGTNQKLRLRDTGESIKRRLRLAPFEYKAEVPDKLLLDKLKAEAPGILYKLIQEANYYLNHIESQTFPRCERIERESAKYFNDENPFGLFFQECVEFAADQSVKTVEVWEAYKSWAEANAVKPLKKQSLFLELENRNCKIQLTRTAPLVMGLKLQ